LAAGGQGFISGKTRRVVGVHCITATTRLKEKASEQAKEDKLESSHQAG